MAIFPARCDLGHEANPKNPKSMTESPDLALRSGSELSSPRRPKRFYGCGGGDNGKAERSQNRLSAWGCPPGAPSTQLQMATCLMCRCGVKTEVGGPVSRWYTLGLSSRTGGGTRPGEKPVRSLLSTYIRKCRGGLGVMSPLFVHPRPCTVKWSLFIL